MRRLVAAVESESLGRGAISKVARTTGISRRAIGDGIRELRTQPDRNPLPQTAFRIRRQGAGRKRSTLKDPSLLRDLDRLISPGSGDADAILRWTCKSVRDIASALRSDCHAVSYQTVAELLREMGYSLRSRQKAAVGSYLRDRDEQFHNVNRQAQQFLDCGEPVLFVENTEINPLDEPTTADPTAVSSTPQRSVSSASACQTSFHAAETLHWWWRWVGQPVYQNATRILITADTGAFAERVWHWKAALRQLADESGLEILFCHFPPGTTRWNFVDYSLVSMIRQSCRGNRSTRHEVTVNVIAPLGSKKGSEMMAAFETAEAAPRIKSSGGTPSDLQNQPDSVQDDWNYYLKPRPKSHIS